MRRKYCSMVGLVEDGKLSAFKTWSTFDGVSTSVIE